MHHNVCLKAPTECTMGLNPSASANFCHAAVHLLVRLAGVVERQWLLRDPVGEALAVEPALHVQYHLNQASAHEIRSSKRVIAWGVWYTIRSKKQNVEDASHRDLGMTSSSKHGSATPRATCQHHFDDKHTPAW